MKTWIVTFEIIAFLVLYFPHEEQHRPPLKVLTSSEVFTFSADKTNCISYSDQEFWYSNLSTLADHIRPPPPTWGELLSFLIIKLHIENQQALSSRFRPSLLRSQITVFPY